MCATELAMGGGVAAATAAEFLWRPCPSAASSHAARSARLKGGCRNAMCSAIASNHLPQRARQVAMGGVDRSDRRCASREHTLSVASHPRGSTLA